MTARWILLALVLASCAEPVVRFEILVRARADGAPMAGVQIAEGGVVLGQTGEDGALSLVTERAEGATLGLVADCREGFQARPERIVRTLRAWAPIDASAGSPPLAIDVVCHRVTSDVVIVVDAGRPNLPVAVDGAVVESTNEAGLAHLLLQGPPGRRVLVSIDTTDAPALAPASPERSFTLGDDAVLYWQTRFEALSAPAAEPPSRRRRSGRRVPERIR